MTDYKEAARARLEKKLKAGVDVCTDTKGHQQIVQLNRVDAENLRGWLEHPNGSFTPKIDPPRARVTFESVEGGGILVRTSGYGVVDLT